MVVRLLQRFDKLEAASLEPVKWSVSLTGRPKNGVKVRLHVAADEQHAFGGAK